MAQAIGSERDGMPAPVKPYDLAALDEAVLNAVSFEQMMDGVSAAVAPALGAELCGVMIWEPVQDALQLLPGSFGADKAATASYRISSSDVASNAARVFTTRRRYLSNRARRGPRDPAGLQRGVRDLAAAARCRSASASSAPA